MADRVLLRVDLLFPCEEITLDPATGHYTVVNPGLSMVRMPGGQIENAVLENLWLFAQVLDGLGEFQLRIEVRNESGLRVARTRGQKHRFAVDDRSAPKQFAFRLSEILFRKPGLFRICLLAGEAELENGSIDLRVLPGAEP